MASTRKFCSRITILLGFLALASVPTGRGQGNFTTIFDALTSLNLTMLIDAANATGLGPTIRNPNSSVTLFAPTNDAFTYLNDTLSLNVTRSFNNSQLVEGILLYHIVLNASVVFKDNLVLPTALARLNLTNTTTNLVAKNLTNTTWYLGGMIPGASINIANKTVAGKSVIYTVDTVLIPPSAIFNVSLTISKLLHTLDNTTILQHLIAADSNITAVANNSNIAITLFAPTDTAFNAFFQANNLTLEDLQGTPLARRVLLNHVIPSFPLTSVDVQVAGNLTIQTASNYSSDVVTLSSTMQDDYAMTEDSYNVGMFTVQGSGNTKPINVSVADEPAGMSVVHLIEGIILPNMTTSDHRR